MKLKLATQALEADLKGSLRVFDQSNLPQELWITNVTVAAAH